jgi:hypothetical protein
MTSRHRHSRRSRLIEIVEVEEGKAEFERRKNHTRRMSMLSDARITASAKCFWFSSLFVQQGGNVYIALTRVCGKSQRKLADEEGGQAPSLQRGSCRTFLPEWTEERRGAANASCWM